MASKLYGLPKEILDQIITSVSPDDVVKFSLVCKALQAYCQVSGELGQRMQRRTDYNELCLDTYKGSPLTPDPLVFLNQMTRDWRLSHYIKTVSVEWCWWNRIGCPTLMKRHCGDLGYLLIALHEPTQTQLSLLVMLLQMFVSMDRLILMDFPDDHHCRLGNLVRNVKARENNFFDFPTGQSPFSKLQAVEILRSRSPGDPAFDDNLTLVNFDDAFGPFMELSSVNTLRARNVRWYYIEQRCIPHITTSELTDCTFTSRISLSSFFEAGTRLRRFVYHTTHDHFSHGRADLTYFILAAMADYTRDSLEYFQITGPQVDHPSQPSICLKRFRNLDHVHLSLYHFIEFASPHPNHQKPAKMIQWASSFLPLSTILPASVTKVVVDVNEPNLLYKAEELVRNLSDDDGIARREVLWLEHVQFESKKFTTQVVERLTERLAAGCEKTGIEIAFCCI